MVAWATAGAGAPCRVHKTPQCSFRKETCRGDVHRLHLSQSSRACSAPPIPRHAGSLPAPGGPSPPLQPNVEAISRLQDEIAGCSSASSLFRLLKRSQARLLVTGLVPLAWQAAAERGLLRPSPSTCKAQTRHQLLTLLVELGMRVATSLDAPALARLAAAAGAVQGGGTQVGPLLAALRRRAAQLPPAAFDPCAAIDTLCVLGCDGPQAGALLSHALDRCLPGLHAMQAAALAKLLVLLIKVCRIEKEGGQRGVCGEPAMLPGAAEPPFPFIPHGTARGRSGGHATPHIPSPSPPSLTPDRPSPPQAGRWEDGSVGLVLATLDARIDQLDALDALCTLRCLAAWPDLSPSLISRLACHIGTRCIGLCAPDLCTLAGALLHLRHVPGGCASFGWGSLEFSGWSGRTLHGWVGLGMQTVIVKASHG